MSDMSNLGFRPVQFGIGQSSDYIFICYKREDSKRIAPIAHCLDEMGVSMWYDQGTPGGNEWSKTISQKIAQCKAMIFFASEDVFLDAETFTRTEWNTANNPKLKKPIYPIWLDNIREMTLDDSLLTWHAQVLEIEGFKAYETNGDNYDIAWKIVNKFDLKYNPEKLIGCAYKFLGNHNFRLADELFNALLEEEEEDVRIYLGKLLVDSRVSKIENLAYCEEPLENNKHYEKVIRLGDERYYKNQELSSMISGYNDQIKERIELKRKENIYRNAKNKMDAAILEKDWHEAEELFGSISEYKDARDLADECRKNAEFSRKVASATAKKLGSGMKDEAVISKNGSGRTIEPDVKKTGNRKNRRAYRVNLKRRRKNILLRPEICLLAVIGVVIGVYNLRIAVQRHTLKEKGEKYQTAVSYVRRGNYEAASKFLEELQYEQKNEKDSTIYFDSEWLLSAIRPVKPETRLEKIQPGSHYLFGAYEQDNDLSNGKEDIEWIVLEKEDNRILLISRYALEAKAYNEERVNVTWETCSLRKWLNDDFLTQAFSEREMEYIQPVTVHADSNPHYDTDPGNDTTDRVFLLSINEFSTYVSSYNLGRCIPSAYAIANGADCSRGDVMGWWWLRSPGDYSFDAACVGPSGGISEFGDFVDDSSVCVRPALWLNL